MSRQRRKMQILQLLSRGEDKRPSIDDTMDKLAAAQRRKGEKA